MSVSRAKTAFAAMAVLGALLPALAQEPAEAPPLRFPEPPVNQRADRRVEQHARAVPWRGESERIVRRQGQPSRQRLMAEHSPEELAGPVMAAARQQPGEFLLDERELLLDILESVENAPTTLAGWEELALERHPGLAMAAARVRAAEGRFVQAGLYPNPRVGYMGDEIGDDGAAGMQGAFVRQEFVTGGKLVLGQSVANQEIERARHELEAVRYRVQTDVRVHFYKVLAAQERLKLAGELKQLADETARTTKSAWEDAKLLAEKDYLQAQIEADQAAITFDLARNDHAAAYRQLAAVTGAGEANLVDLEGSLTEALPDIAWESAVQRVLDDSPLLAAGRAEVARSGLAATRARAEVIPNIDAQVAVQHNFANDDVVTSVDVGVALPIFNRNQGAVQEKLAETAAALRNLQRLRLKLRQQLAVAYRDYEDAKAQVSGYKKVAATADRTLKIFREAERRQVSTIEVLRVQRDYIQAKVSYLDALERLWAAAARIEGLLLEGGLEQ